MAGNSARRPGMRGVCSGLAALALLLSAASFVPLTPSVSDSGAPPPLDYNVTIEFIRILRPSSSYESDAVPLRALAPAARWAMKEYLEKPEADLYNVVRKRKIHLGIPQLVSMDRRDQIEFRLAGGSAECAFLRDGVVTDSSSGTRMKISDDPFLCSFHRRDQDLYVVGWMGVATPAPNWPPHP
jgi:hypothetical protein